MSIIWQGQGNVLDDKYPAIIPVNASGTVLGKPLEQAVARYPELKDIYTASYAPGHRTPAVSDREVAKKVVLARIPKAVGAKDKCLILLCTRYHWREGSDIRLIAENLKTIADQFDNGNAWGIHGINVPMLGAGLVDLPLAKVKTVIINTLKDRKIPVNLYL